MVADVRGVVLNDQAGGARFEFSDVTSVRWTASALIITGTVHGPGRIEHGVFIPPNPAHGETRSIEFSLGDVSHVLVHNRVEQAEIGVAMLVGAALTAPAFLFLLVWALTTGGA